MMKRSLLICFLKSFTFSSHWNKTMLDIIICEQSSFFLKLKYLLNNLKKYFLSRSITVSDTEILLIFGKRMCLISHIKISLFYHAKGHKAPQDLWQSGLIGDFFFCKIITYQGQFKAKITTCLRGKISKITAAAEIARKDFIFIIIGY